MYHIRLPIEHYQPVSTIDYPGQIASVLYTQGCNFSCPYCHNENLIPFKNYDTHLDNEHLNQVIASLQKSIDRNLISHLVITGGEPTIHRELKDFLKIVKAMGYKVKLDTNGSHPDRLQKLIDKKLVDYIAMDIKTSLNNYAPHIVKTISPEVMESILKKSIDIIRTSGIAYEFRTTCLYPFVTKSVLQDIVTNVITKDDPYYLQVGNTNPRWSKFTYLHMRNYKLDSDSDLMLNDTYLQDFNIKIR